MRQTFKIFILMATCIIGFISQAQLLGSSDNSNNSTLVNAIGQELVILSVVKNSLTAELSTLPSPGTLPRLLKKFQIALGKEDGDKEKQGDNRTPEGIYFTQHHIDGKTLPEKYGAFAIPIDFPNPIDQIQGKTGYGIWLHGVENAQRISAAKVTEGCVAFYNEDISNLSKWLQPFQGIVAISREKNQLNRQEDVAELMRNTEEWAQSWAKRDHANYINHYHEAFNTDGKNYRAYSEYKKRVFASYKVMDLRIDDIRVVTHPKYAVSIMNQDFRGDQRFISKGRKVLYWQKNSSGEYRIVNEGFQRKRFEKISADQLEQLSVQKAEELKQSRL
ncbi:MAG: L,D-transpeptidase family protein [Oligoflexales bacterium]|nr:L,D-transpeptidase family protein [Oligoflexales bacterium]